MTMRAAAPNAYLSSTACRPLPIISTRLLRQTRISWNFRGMGKRLKCWVQASKTICLEPCSTTKHGTANMATGMLPSKPSTKNPLRHLLLPPKSNTCSPPKQKLPRVSLRLPHTTTTSTSKVYSQTKSWPTCG